METKLGSPKMSIPVYAYVPAVHRHTQTFSLTSLKAYSPEILVKYLRELRLQEGSNDLIFCAQSSFINLNRLDCNDRAELS